MNYPEENYIEKLNYIKKLDNISDEEDLKFNEETDRKLCEARKTNKEIGIISKDIIQLSRDLSDDGNGITFVRRFRWTLTSDCGFLSEQFNDRVKINFKNKTIKLRVIDSIPNSYSLDNWINNVNDETVLTLIALDGMGNCMYEHKFKSISVTSDTIKFDQSSDVCKRNIKFNYVTMVKTY